MRTTPFTILSPRLARPFRRVAIVGYVKGLRPCVCVIQGTDFFLLDLCAG